MRKVFRNSESRRLEQSSRSDKGAASFLRSERGTMTILTLSLILIIFTVGGFAVDMMRYDHERARLQYSLDRAVLAAADLQQDLCPKDVVQDYLVKENLDTFLDGEVVVSPRSCDDDGNKLIVGQRRVEASATMPVRMHFMKWWDVDSINVNVVSVAEESIGNVEIAMVLDVSGSMRGSRLTNLQGAAKSFVTKMYENTSSDKLSISIIPYATQVGVPSAVMNQLTTAGSNRFANCIDFETSDLAAGAFDLTKTYNQSLYYSRYGGDQRPSGGFSSPRIDERCRSEASRQLVVHQNNETNLHNYIDSFYARDNTSINVGMKWALTVLDENFRPVVTNMIANGQVPADFAGRPADSVGSDTMKVIVLMTDGENTSRTWVKPPYNDGQSGIWWNGDEDIYSVNVNHYDEDEDSFRYAWLGVDRAYWDSSRGKYWVRDEYQDHAFGNSDFDVYLCRGTYYSSGYCDNLDRDEVRQIDENGTAFSLTWPALWERTSRYEIYKLLYDSVGSTYAYNWYYAATETENRSTKDDQVEAMCDYAKSGARNILIFSVAYEATTNGRNLLWYCKSDENAYFAPTGSEIGEVFDDIAASIQNLRLTQ
jgi:Flp pilus assembly protein TadG